MNANNNKPQANCLEWDTAEYRSKLLLRPFGYSQNPHMHSDGLLSSRRQAAVAAAESPAFGQGRGSIKLSLGVGFHHLDPLFLSLNLLCTVIPCIFVMCAFQIFSPLGYLHFDYFLVLCILPNIDFDDLF